jgi:hypothetical protein
MPELNSDEILHCFERLAELETEFEEVDIQILRETTLKQQPLFERRNIITGEIQNFWPNVFEEASATISLDEHITPEDAEALASLTEFNVTRPDVQNGDPRNLEISFTFKGNDYMPPQTVVKKFTYQPSERPGLTGLISTPTAIAWKEGKDLTSGVNKLAIAVFEDRKARAASKDKKGKGSMNLTDNEEKLLKLLENPSSFFNWFSYTGAHQELGEVDDSDESPNDEESPLKPIDCFPYGDELAVQFAEDLYPSAVKYFTSSLEECEEEPDEEIDLDSEFEEQAMKNAIKSKPKRNCVGSDTHEPAKKKPRNEK